MRSKMSIDWTDKEQKSPGIIVNELRKVKIKKNNKILIKIK